MLTEEESSELVIAWKKLGGPTLRGKTGLPRASLFKAVARFPVQERTAKKARAGLEAVRQLLKAEASATSIAILTP